MINKLNLLVPNFEIEKYLLNEASSISFNNRFVNSCLGQKVLVEESNQCSADFFNYSLI